MFCTFLADSPHVRPRAWYPQNVYFGLADASNAQPRCVEVKKPVRKLPLLILLTCALLLASCSRGADPTAVIDPTAEPTPEQTAEATATPSGSDPLPTATRTTTAAGTPTAPRAAASATPSRSASPTALGTPLPTLTGGENYRDPQLRFSFMIPNDWTQVQAAGAEVAFQAPAPSGTIPATVNVVLEKLPSASVTLDEYDQAGEANLKQQFPDYKSVSLTKVSVDGKPAYKRVYTATIAGRVLQLQQVYLIERDVAYLITCGAPQESFAANAAVFDQISGTFKIGR